MQFTYLISFLALTGMAFAQAAVDPQPEKPQNETQTENTVSPKVSPPSESTAKAEPAAETTGAPLPIAEIGLSTGEIRRGMILRQDKTQVVYHDTATNSEKILAQADVIFIRNVDGKYQFNFGTDTAQPTTVEAEKPGNTTTAWFLFGGVGFLTTDNSAVTGFIDSYAKALATDLNTRYALGGFRGESGQEAARLSGIFTADLRYLWRDLYFGFSLGYSFLPKSSAVVSSANYSSQETLNIDGYFIPALFTVYFPLFESGIWRLNLGVGGGALFSSVLLTLNNGSKSDYEEVRTLSPAVHLQPELMLSLASLTVIVSVPIYWAESLPIGNMGETLTISNRVTTASMSGVGLQIAAGYKL